MDKPKILFLDIETQPDLVWTWGVYDQNAIAVKEHWQVLSVGWAWGDGKIEVLGRDDLGGKDDYKVVAKAWALLDEADIVVAHNGAAFDLRKLTARFIAHEFKPPSPYRVVDTKAEVSRIAAFSSNKLDWLAKQLEIGSKLEHEGWQLWLDCIEGDPKAWKKMKEYNARDVDLLRQLYSEISPWIRQPNANVWANRPVCPKPNCGSKRLEARGLARNKTRVYRRYQCKDCGGWAREVTSERDIKASLTACE